MANTITNDDLDKQKPGVLSQPAGQPGTPTGAQPAPSVAQPVRPQVGTQTPAPKGTNFTNIQRIIGANQGNKLGSTVVGGVQQVGQQAQQGLNDANQQFQTGLNQNRLDNGTNIVASNNLITTAAKGGQLSDSDYAQAEKFRQGQYTGPMGLNNASTLAGQAADAEQLGKLGGSEGGRQGLLQRFVGAPQYNAGQQRLDNLLLGGDAKAINQARSATQGLADKSARQIQAAQAQGQQAVNGAQNFSQKFLQDTAAKTAGLNSTTDAAYKAAQDAETLRQNNFANFGSSLDSNTKGIAGVQSIINSSTALNDTQKQDLSNIVAQAKQLGVDPTNAIKQSLQSQQAQGLSREGVMSQQQAAGINALQKLAGNEGYTNANAGTFQAGSQTEDASKSKNALAAIQNYKGDMGNTAVTGQNDKNLLNSVVTSPEQSFRNPSAAKQLLTPQEFKQYTDMAATVQQGPNPYDSAAQQKFNGATVQYNQLQKIFAQRAQDNLNRLNGNDKGLQDLKSSFNKTGGY